MIVELGHLPILGEYFKGAVMFSVLFKTVAFLYTYTICTHYFQKVISQVPRMLSTVEPH